MPPKERHCSYLSEVLEGAETLGGWTTATEVQLAPGPADVAIAHGR